MFSYSFSNLIQFVVPILALQTINISLRELVWIYLHPRGCVNSGDNLILIFVFPGLYREDPGCLKITNWDCSCCSNSTNWVHSKSIILLLREIWQWKSPSIIKITVPTITNRTFRLACQLKLLQINEQSSKRYTM